LSQRPGPTDPSRVSPAAASGAYAARVRDILAPLRSDSLYDLSTISHLVVMCVLSMT
jgi:hypothetical protein